MRRVALLLFLLAACTSGSSSDATSKHVLIVGIDGLRIDALEFASTPRIDALVAEGTVTYDAVAGGELGGETEQPTFSGPGWSSILTGVWADKHGVELNVFDDARFDLYPHFFARVRERDPEAYLSSFATWSPINDDILASANANEAFTPRGAADSAEGDRWVTEAVVSHLREQSPRVVFVHLDEVDRQGHVAGFSASVPEYVQAIEVVDGQLGRMLDAIESRSTRDAEDWLIVVTTDHGGIGQGHGGQTDDEREIFMIVRGGAAQPSRVVSPGPGHTAVPPTAMKHLGLPVDPAWGWESPAFGL